MTDPDPIQTIGEDEGERTVTVLELFFDLVFVLAITQVTQFFAQHESGRGFYEGVLILALVWWSWVGYAWLTNSVDIEDARTRIAFFAAMTGFVIVALATPHAFGDDATTFAAAYGVVRFMQVALYVRGSRERPAERAAILGLAPGFFASFVLLLVGSLIGGDAQLVIWALALVVDIGAPLIFGTEGFHVRAGHFAERHGLIVIIALGESIVAVGNGASGQTVDLALVTGATLGVAAAAAMWWAYFDIVAIVAAHRLGQAHGDERNRIARDSYSYFHFFMIAGIVLTALGIKKTLAHTGQELGTIPAIALCAGPALYLAGHVLFRKRNVHTWNRQRIVAGGVLLALIPLVDAATPALASLALVTAVLVGLVAYEAIRFGEARDRLRARLA